MEGAVSEQEIEGVNVTGVPLMSPDGELHEDPLEELLLDMQRQAAQPEPEQPKPA